MPGEPASQTTEDPLSPPCMSWDLQPGANDPTHGIYADHIDVTLLGGDPSYDYNAVPTPDDCDRSTNPSLIQCVDRNWRVLLRFFKANFQTYGRSVVVHPYAVNGVSQGQCTGPYFSGGGVCTSAQQLADDIALHQTYKPFAVLVLRSLYIRYDDVPPLHAINTHGVQWIDHPALEFPFVRYHAAALSQDYWSFDPTIEDIEDQAASWLCRSVAGTAGHTVTQSTQFSGRPRRLVLVYTENVWQPDVYDLRDRTNRLCGNGGDVFDGAPRSVKDGTNAPTLAVAQMAARQDTSLVCFFCFDTKDLDAAAAQAGYSPEKLFVSGHMGDGFDVRSYDQTAFDPTSQAGSFGVSDQWQTPAFLATYWSRAYSTVDPTSTATTADGNSAYEILMALFAGIQLAGADLNPQSFATGLYQWQRSFVPPAAGGLTPGGRPGAGFTPDDHSFVKGMMEERWDSTGIAPGGSYPSPAGKPNGCFRIIDFTQRFTYGALAGHRVWGLELWPTSDDSTLPAASAPCTAELQSEIDSSA